MMIEATDIDYLRTSTIVTHNIEQQPNSDVHDQEVVELDDDMNLQDKADDFEEIQPNKKRKSTSAKPNEKGKKAEKK
ncbi:hypothetical protein F8M41_015069 [Gigaspora margarita]|uniref:Uncharacterized protein n=1 Tax=Gigaspora margarita TaxID=4874 RepID=A0A8H3WUL0_GIGMA|nr:hypothetical protein F8M41_015069 [Gigaspora margarita]